MRKWAEARLIKDVLLALGKVEMIEQVLHCPEEPTLRVYGCQEGNTVWVNPITSRNKKTVVGTLIHEAIHFVRKSYSETKTEQVTDQIYTTLSPADEDAIYKIYSAFVRRRKGRAIV